jgi:hypothetical protein
VRSPELRLVCCGVCGRGVGAYGCGQGCRALYCCCTAHAAGMWPGFPGPQAAAVLLMQPAWGVGCGEVGYEFSGAAAVAVIWCHLKGSLGIVQRPGPGMPLPAIKSSCGQFKCVAVVSSNSA